MKSKIVYLSPKAKLLFGLQSWLKSPFEKRGPIFIILFPFLFLLSWLIYLIPQILKKLRFSRKSSQNCYLLGIGNLEWGGGGKSPFVLWLCRYQEKLSSGGILSRGYPLNNKVIANHESHPFYPNSQTIDQDLNDENKEFFRSLKKTIIFQFPRKKEILKETLPSWIIVDDAWQTHGLTCDGFFLLLNPDHLLKTPDYGFPLGYYRNTFGLKSLETQINRNSLVGRIWSRIPQKDLPLLSQFKDKLLECSQKYHFKLSLEKDFIVTYKQKYVSSLDLKDDIYASPDVNLESKELSSAAILTGIANPHAFLKGIEADFPQSSFTLYALEDHAPHVPLEFFVQEHSSIIITSKDYFRWNHLPFFKVLEKRTNIFISLLNIDVIDLEGEIITPSHLLSSLPGFSIS
jgi:tetraacyldisaccharide-1-P 4'-kinase